jgi:hypothetical protein
MNTPRLLIAMSFAALASQSSARETIPAWTDPAAATRECPDFAIQGEYTGDGTGVQVIARGKGEFEAVIFKGGLPGAGWEPGNDTLRLKGKRDGDKIGFHTDKNTTSVASLENGIFSFIEPAAEKPIRELRLPRAERTSPTLGAQPPDGAIILFDGTSTDEWNNAKMENGLLLATGLTTKREFSDFKIHLEFRTPYMPDARGQKRGNSGVYYGARWETQVLDSFGLVPGPGDCGGIYSISPPRLNMCLQPLAWQTYDVEFTAAKFNDAGERTAWPRITVRLNGVLIHDDLELNKDFTPAAPVNTPLVRAEGPIFLQNHNDPVVFRNIWVVEKK